MLDNFYTVRTFEASGLWHNGSIMKCKPLRCSGTVCKYNIDVICENIFHGGTAVRGPGVLG